MLFLGSEKYPTEDAFSSFVNANGGKDNAYTDKTHTNFFFEINSDRLPHALDIWSRFFIDPLLSMDGIVGEINAVDNEYRKDIPNQEWRDWRMLEYSANPNDPFSKFSVGSIEILNKSGIYEQLQHFHETYFVANLMKGVIIGNYSIETLESFAIDYFFGIVNNSNVQTPKYEDTIPYTDEQKDVIYFIKSIVRFF